MSFSKYILIDSIALVVLISCFSTMGCKSAVGYAQDNIPSLAGYFSCFNDMNKETEAYIDEVRYVLERADYASDLVEERVARDTSDNIIDSNELTGIQNLDNDAYDNKTEIANGTNIVDPYNKLPPVPESIEIINSPLYPQIAANEELSDGFNLQNYSSAIKHLEYTPYVLNNPEVFEAFNRKIIREDSIWYDVLNIEDNEELWTNPEWGRIANWNYHWNASPQAGNVAGRVTLMPWYDSEKMKGWYPDTEDRNQRLNEMWIPRSFLFYDWTNGGRSTANVDCLKNNLSNLIDWYNRIMTAYNNPDSEEHEKARLMLEHNILDRGNNGWENTSEQFRPLLERFMEDESLAPLIFGYGYINYLNSWMGPPEIREIWGTELYSIYGASLVAKTLGTSVDFFSGTAFDDVKIPEVAYPVKRHLRDEIENTPEIYGHLHVGKGSSIGILSPIEGKMEDSAIELAQSINGKLILIWSPELPYFDVTHDCGLIEIKRNEIVTFTFNLNVASINDFNSPVQISLGHVYPSARVLNMIINQSTLTPPPNGTASTSITMTVEGLLPMGHAWIHVDVTCPSSYRETTYAYIRLNITE